MNNRSTVFIIDDDQALCHLLRWLLESIGLSVETFHNAEAFLAKFCINQRGCLIIDVRMPGMSGLELQSLLNAMYNPLPVITC